MGKPHFRASLYHIDRARSAPLEPPWPDLILTVGRRPSMAALWVKAQAQAASTGRGRSSQALARPLRSGDRTATVPGPKPPQRAASGPAAHARGRGRGHHRGGRLAPSIRRPAAATARAARRRPDQALRVRPDGRQAPDRRMPAHHRGRGRHLVRHDQPPHAAAVVEAIAAALPAGARLYRWDAGGDNPYHALLGLADRFVVTGDSISMMVEVARLGKPLAIFALPASGDWLRLRSASASAWRRSGMPREALSPPSPTRSTGCASPSMGATCRKSTAACMRAGSPYRSASRSGRRRRARRTI